MFIQKTTRQERVKNTHLIDQLDFCFFDRNIAGIKSVLSDKGVFLGKSKLAFLSSLNSLFIELREKGVCGVNIHSGICIDTLPGCEVIEVRYALSSDLLDENGAYFTSAKCPERKGEVVLRLALQFSQGEVISIRRTNAYIEKNFIDPEQEWSNN